MLANWGTYPTLAKGDDIAALWSDNADNIYRFSDRPLSLEHNIPLYGIQEYTGVTLTPNMLLQLGRIHLLRAYAKVEVNLSPNVQDVESLTISRVNPRGYKAPLDVDEVGDYVHNSYEADYANTLHIPVIAREEVIGDFKMTYAGGEPGGFRRYIAYIPEYDNTSAGAVKSFIKINYADKTFDPDHRIEFKYYQATGPHGKDEPFDLTRNYWYRFNVTGGPSTITVDVQPYALVTLKPNFGLERDEDGNIIIRDQDGNIIRIVMVDNTVLNFDPFTIPNIGESTGVFDENNHCILAYLKDGRKIVYNYCDLGRTELMSWEIYSSEDDEEHLVHLEEEYIRYRYNWETKKYEEEFHHNYYDDGGCLITRYVYPGDDSFNNRPQGGESSDAIRTVRYEGDLYGDKTVYHYKYDAADGTLKLFLKVIVTKKEVTDEDGNTSYIYEETYEEV